MKNNLKKIGATTVLATMILGTVNFPQTVSAEEAYVINEDYSQGNVGGWVKNGTAGALTAVGVKEDGTIAAGEDEVSNWAVSFTGNTGKNGYGHGYAINDFSEKNIDYKTDETFVLKTRVMLNDNDAETDGTKNGCGYFKYNMDPTATSEAGLNLYTLFMLDPNNGATYINNISQSNNWHSGTAVFEDLSIIKQWVDVEIRAEKGKKTADVTFTAGNNTKTVTVKRMEAFESLKNIGLRVNNGATVYVDYVKAYWESNAEASVSETIYDTNAVTVTLNSAKEIGDFSDCVDLYLAGEKVTAQKTFEATDRKYTVSMNPENLVAGGNYKVKFDTAKLAEMKIALSNDTTEFNVTVLNSAVNEDYGKDDKGSWIKSGNGTLTTVGVNADGTIATGDEEVSNWAISFTGDSGNNGYAHGYALADFSEHELEYFEDKVFVLKTRVMLDDHDAKNTSDSTTSNGYAQFKYNMIPNNSFTVEERTDVTNENSHALYTLFSIDPATEKIKPVDDLSLNKTHNSKNPLSVTPVTNKWIDVEVRSIKGQTASTATFTVDDKSETVTIKHMDALEAFKNIGLRANNGATVYVDYVKTSYEKPTYIRSCFVDEEGKTVTEISKAGTILPKFEMSNGKGAKKCTFISALYINGELCDVHTYPVDTDSVVYTETNGYTIPEVFENYEIKTFVWDSVNGLVPLGGENRISAPQ